MTTIYLKSQFLLLNLVLLLLTSCLTCSDKEKKDALDHHNRIIISKRIQKSTKHFKGKHVPVLCYHAIRNINKEASANQITYSVSPSHFKMQIETLATNGYTSITPDNLKDFYTTGKPLPEKPIVITFDDGRKEHYTIAAKTLDKYHLKGVFFIMTVTMGKQHYMSKEDIKALSDEGHIIGCHTWDHHKVTDYKKNDWHIQLAKPKQQLENIIHKPINCFAYPYGVWNLPAADSIKHNGYSTAYIVYGKDSPSLPLYTLQRIIVKNTWSAKDFLYNIEKSY